MVQRMIFMLFSLLLFLSVATPIASAAYPQCSSELSSALKKVMGTEGKSQGYFQQLRDLTSTNIAPHLLIEQIEELAHDARIELKGMCDEIRFFPDIDQRYASIYGLESCREPKKIVIPEENLSLATQCQNESNHLLQTFLNSMASQILLSAVRTSLTPMLERMRSLNGRLISLIQEYNRLISNFSKFSFRLGDTIIKKSD